MYARDHLADQMYDDTSKKTRASVRFSTYSMASAAPTFRTTDSALAEISPIENSLDRLNDGNKELDSQRVELNEERREYFKKLALGAKLDKALGRRMSSQDAVFRPRAKSAPGSKALNEKSEEVSA